MLLEGLYLDGAHRSYGGSGVDIPGGSQSHADVAESHGQWVQWGGLGLDLVI